MQCAPGAALYLLKQPTIDVTVRGLDGGLNILAAVRVAIQKGVFKLELAEQMAPREMLAQVRHHQSQLKEVEERVLEKMNE